MVESVYVWYFFSILQLFNLIGSFKLSPCSIKSQGFSTQQDQKKKYLVGFEVLTVVSTKMAVFWVAAPCSLVEVYQHFRGLCCLHNQGDE
jgi:hypothetical protein